MRIGSKPMAAGGTAAAKMWTLAAVAVVAVLGGGVALASIPDSGTGVFHGCYSTKTGALRLIDPSKGQKCATGEQAASWNQAGIAWQGTWSSTTAYRVGDGVADNGSSYLAIKASTDNTPSGNPSYWAVLAQAGQVGKSGRRGPAGPQGPAGATLLPEQIAFGVGYPDVLNGSNYQFSGPQGIAFDGSHMWITNSTGNSVTEVNASDGSLVRVLTNTSGNYEFDGPGWIFCDGSHLWISNSAGNTVTEVNASDGSLVRVLSNTTNPNYMFDSPAGMAFDGIDMWIANSSGGSVTEVNSSDGSLVRVIPVGGSPIGLVFDGAQMWVTGSAGVTSLNLENGQPQATVSTPSGAAGIVFDGNNLWVADSAGNEVTEISSADRSVVQNLSAPSYGFNDPQRIAFDGSHLWVTNSVGDSVTEINASDGSLVRVAAPADGNFDGPVGIAFDGSHLWVAMQNRTWVTAFEG